MKLTLYTKYSNYHNKPLENRRKACLGVIDEKAIFKQLTSA